MIPSIRNKLLAIDRLMDEILGECFEVMNEVDTKKPSAVQDTDDAALVQETVGRAQSILSEIPLQYK